MAMHESHTGSIFVLSKYPDMKEFSFLFMVQLRNQKRLTKLLKKSSNFFIKTFVEIIIRQNYVFMIYFNQKRYL